MTRSGTLTADGNSETFTAGARSAGLGGFNTFFASGTWGGGTLKVQASPDNGSTWFDVAGSELTADSTVNFQIMAPLFRLSLAGATSPNINWWVV